MRENPDIDISEPQTYQTLRDLWRDSGLSDEALEQVMAFVPFNPNISLDESDELLANMQAVVDAIDAIMRASMADVTLDEARIMVNILKNDPTTTEDEYRYITRELFSPDIQQALIRTGVCLQTSTKGNYGYKATAYGVLVFLDLRNPSCECTDCPTDCEKSV